MCTSFSRAWFISQCTCPRGPSSPCASCTMVISAGQFLNATTTIPQTMDWSDKQHYKKHHAHPKCRFLASSQRANIMSARLCNFTVSNFCSFINQSRQDRFISPVNHYFLLIVHPSPKWTLNNSSTPRPSPYLLRVIFKPNTSSSLHHCRECG